MSNIKNTKIDSKTYERIKADKKLLTSLRHKGKTVSQDTRQKLSRFRLNKTYEEIMGVEQAGILKQRLSEQRKGKGTGQSNPMYGKLGPLHHNYGKTYNAGKNNPMYGKSHSQETREKIRTARKGNTANTKKPLSPALVEKVVSSFLDSLDLKGVAALYQLSQSEVLRILKGAGYYPSGRRIDEFRVRGPL